VVLDAQNFGDRYVVSGCLPGRHPLLEAALASYELDGVEVSINSPVPPGCSTGTSAAVAVALIGALDRWTGVDRPPAAVASAAHRLEVERLGLESGIQDQLCAAYGGINFIDMTAYPSAVVTPVAVAADVWAELDRRLVLVHLGRAHVSSDVHRAVIERLASQAAALDRLRGMAVRARDALAAGDLVAYGRALSDNTEAQADLHPGLVSDTARRLIDIARAHGALGWKVNGAGGDGGSLAILTASASADSSGSALVSALLSVPGVRVIPIRLSAAGLQVSDR
jgi:D-glycero-alpha-D-manno-heptose-7-phosphate kinase